MADRKRDVLVGAVVSIAIVVAVIGTIWLKGGWGEEGRILGAVSSNVGQMMDGASVKFRGVNVGRVGAISVLENGQGVRFEMTVLSELQLPANAAVLIAPESMFGDWQAEIVDQRDFPRYQFYASNESGLLPGAALPDLSRLTAAADEIAQNVTTISERVQLAFTEETAMNLQRAIGNIEQVSNGLADILTQQTARFNEMADGVDESTIELAGAARAARTSFERIDQLLADAQIDSVVMDTRMTARNVRVATETFGVAIQDLQGVAMRADSTFARLDRITANIESGEGSVGRIFGDPTLALHAEGAIADLRALLADIQANPSRYVRISIF